MKTSHWFLLPAVAIALAAFGCGKKEVDTSELEKAFNSVPASAPGAGQADPVIQIADQALTAIKNNDYEGGAVALQTLRSSPTLNANQLTAVQDAMAAFQKQLVERAERGDPNAQRALEAMKTMRR